jgi:hypothetical protein
LKLLWTKREYISNSLLSLILVDDNPRTQNV